jgi:hypothetical protein
MVCIEMTFMVENGILLVKCKLECNTKERIKTKSTQQDRVAAGKKKAWGVEILVQYVLTGVYPLFGTVPPFLAILFGLEYAR